MRGSASNNMVAKALFVPDDLMLLHGQRARRRRSSADPSTESRDRWPAAAIIPWAWRADAGRGAPACFDFTVANLDKKA